MKEIIRYIESEITIVKLGMIDRFIGNLGRAPNDYEKNEMFDNIDNHAEFYGQYDELALENETFDKGYLTALKTILKFINNKNKEQ